MALKIKTVLGILIGVAACLSGYTSLAQDDSASFRNVQFASSRVSDSWKKYNDTLAKEFRKKSVAYPPKDIYLRAFKSQNEMELWARNSEGGDYKLIKTYHICAVPGSLGPKRIQGDRQVPEGYYFIDDFNNASDFYLSLLINYPNYSDQLLGSQKTGGDIYIHGGCVTVGCLPMTNPGIQEIYTVCLNARLNGQQFIPVHIFPTRLNKNGMAYLGREFPNDAVRQQFWAELKNGYEYFEKYHKLLPVMYTPDGKYAD